MIKKIVLAWGWQFKFPIPIILETLTKTVVVAVILNNILAIFAGLIGLISRIDISPNIYGRKRTLFQFIAIGVWLISLAIEKYFEFLLMDFSIYLINSLLLISIYIGIRSLEDYWKRYQKVI